MSSETHEIVLKAKDGSSQVFRMVGQNAERMNQQIERSNQRTKRSFDDIVSTTRKVGAAVGALSFASIQAANKSEVSQTRLKASIEATGKSYDQYADAIDKASKKAIKLAFDDEDAADAISKLTQATNDAGKAINDLSLAEDIARARGISLEAATNLVVAAEQGRIGALKRVGIALDDNATSEEALAALRTKFAGQADAYAVTNAANWDRAKIAAENAMEAIGAKLAAHQALILGVSTAWTAFGGSVASVAKILGPGGMGALLSVGGIAALAGVSGMAMSSSGTPGNNQWASLFNTLFGGVAGGLNAILPGNPMNTQKYSDAMTANSIEEAIKGLFYSPQGFGNDALIYQALIAMGAAAPGLPLKMKNGQVTGMDISADDWNKLLAAIEQDATNTGLTPGAYLSAKAGKAGLVQDPVSGMWGYPEQISSMQSRRDEALGTGAPIGPPAPMTPSHSETAAGNYPMSSQMGTGLVQDAENARAMTAALQQEYGAWSILADGIITAGDAQAAFKMDQDLTIQAEGKYSGQISEYTGQLNALTAGYDVINKKKEAGIALTQQEQDYLAQYPELYERASGGIDDATESQGFLAAQYIESMKQGDALNATLADNAAGSDRVTAAIYDLIASLNNVPHNVDVAVNANLDPFYNIVNNLLGSVIGSSYINVYANRIGFGASVDGMQHGGLTKAQHGYAGGGSTLVGEAGPEIVSLPAGSFVTPSAASRFSNKGKKGGGGDIVVHQMTVVANNPKQFGDQMRAYALAGARN